MKKSFLVVLAALVCAVACQTQSPEVEPALNVEGLTLAAGNTVAVAAEGTDLNFTVKGNVAYTVSSNQSWAAVTPASVDNPDSKDLSTAVKVAVAANGDSQAREALIKITTEKNPALDYSFTIKQAGNEPAGPSLQVLTTEMAEITAPIEVDANSASASLLVISNVSWTASSNAEWLTVEPASLTIENSEETPATVSFKIEQNDGTESRTATVTFSGEGIEDVVVTVSQAGVCTFELSISDVSSTGAVISAIPSYKDVIYEIQLLSTATFEKYSVEQIIPLLLDETEADVAEYGYTLASYYTEYGYKGDVVEDYFVGKLTPQTSYTFIVFALSIEDETVTPYINGAKTIEFTTLEAVATPEYNQWLGEWTLTGTANGVVNNITISENVPGVSYYVSGLQGFSFKVDGKFNKDNSFSIMVTDTEDYTDETYGPIDMWFYGRAEVDGKLYNITGNPYAICTAVLNDDDNANVSGETIPLTGGTSCVISSMQFVGKILEGTYQGYTLSFSQDGENDDRVSIPATMVRATASSTSLKSHINHFGIKNLNTVSKSKITNLVEVR